MLLSLSLSLLLPRPAHCICKWEQNSGMDVFSYGLNRASTAYNYSTTEQLIELLIRTVRRVAAPALAVVSL